MNMGWKKLALFPAGYPGRSVKISCDQKWKE